MACGTTPVNWPHNCFSISRILFQSGTACCLHRLPLDLSCSALVAGGQSCILSGFCRAARSPPLLCLDSDALIYLVFFPSRSYIIIL